VGDQHAARARWLLVFAADSTRASDAKIFLSDGDLLAGRLSAALPVNEQHPFSDNVRTQFEETIESAGLLQPPREEEVPQSALPQYLEFDEHAGDVAQWIFASVIDYISLQGIKDHLPFMKIDIRKN
jgi:hypothetical protein